MCERREIAGKQKTRPRRNLAFGPRLYRRGIFGQSKQIIQTILGQGDLVNFTVNNIVTTLMNSGYGDTLEEKCREALDKYFDMRQGKTEAIED